MSLYTNWTDMVLSYVKENGEQAFWKTYSEMEQKVYKEILGNYKTVYEGTFENLRNRVSADKEFFMGFLDGINDSLKNPFEDLEVVEENTNIKLDIDFEKLYFNMLDSKADYLYTLPEWDSILSEEKRKEITKDWRKSKTVVNEGPKVGRNDPCPCGSQKKFKKCCGLAQ